MKLLERIARLSPKQKTLLEFAGMGVLIVFATVIIFAVVTYGWWFEMAMFSLAYTITSLVRTLYTIRLEHWGRPENIYRSPLE